MHRTVVSAHEYVRLINNKLREHPLYKPGMRVALGNPSEPHQLTIINESGGGANRAAFAWAQMHIDLGYRLATDAPISADALAEMRNCPERQP